MKWIKSTTMKSWRFEGLTIPSFQGQFLEVNEEVYYKMTQAPVINALIKSGDILVSSTEPNEVARSADRLLDSNAKLKLEVAKLQEENIKLKETTQSDLADVNDALTKQLAEAKAEAEKARAEAEATKKEALEELKKMQAQLKAAKKGE